MMSSVKSKKVRKKYIKSTSSYNYIVKGKIKKYHYMYMFIV